MTYEEAKALLKEWYGAIPTRVRNDGKKPPTFEEALVEGSPEKGAFFIMLFTATNSYKISVHTHLDREPYLGAISNSRVYRAGEDWTRGSDLPDGIFCLETWDKIMRSIVGYEVVPLETPDGKVHLHREVQNG